MFDQARRLSGAAKLGFVDNALVVVECAFRTVLAALAAGGHPPKDCVNAGSDIGVGTVRHQGNLVAGSKLVIGHGCPSKQEGGAQSAARHVSSPED